MNASQPLGSGTFQHPVGELEGKWLGEKVASGSVGPPVGLLVGAEDGPWVGIPLGEPVGCKDGELLGLAVGPIDG
jgi:hypothetical protein